jgi:replication-associated recombination protein RarA
MNTEYKYSPKSIADFVWANDQLERKMMDYANGRNSRPLVLQGPFGTGKSLLATLIPKAIDGDKVLIEYVNAEKLNYDAEVRKVFHRNKHFDSLFVPAGQSQTYTVIDEVNFNPKAKSALRTCLDDFVGRDLTIITTNEIEKLDPAIVSRAEVVFVPPVPPKRFLKQAQKILAAEGVVLDDETVSEVLESTYAKCKDNRAYYKAIDEVISRAANASSQPSVT